MHLLHTLVLSFRRHKLLNPYYRSTSKSEEYQNGKILATDPFISKSDLDRLSLPVRDPVDSEEARHGAAEKDGANDESGGHVIETANGGLGVGGLVGQGL